MDNRWYNGEQGTNVQDNGQQDKEQVTKRCIQLCALSVYLIHVWFFWLAAINLCL